MTTASGAHERVTVGGRTYLVEGRIGVGERADVFRAVSDGPFPELVTIKIARSEGEAGALKREREVLGLLSRSEQRGADHFCPLLPRIVTHGKTDDGLPATVFRRMPSYDWTLADAVREYPDGVDAETGAWMWNRQLMLVHWIHLHRIAHGAIVPEHVLIHPLNHGARLIGWSSSGAWTGGPLRPEEDIASTARVVIRALGGADADGRMRPAVPLPMAELLLRTADMADRQDAFALHGEFAALAERLFGKPRYRPFHLPRPSGHTP